jgi:hypothetical protein
VNAESGFTSVNVTVPSAAAIVTQAAEMGDSLKPVPHAVSVMTLCPNGAISPLPEALAPKFPKHELGLIVRLEIRTVPLTW